MTHTHARTHARTRAPPHYIYIYLIGIVIGVVVLLLSIAVPKFGENVLSVSLNIQSFVIGPLLGLLLVGLFMPWIESWVGINITV